MALKSREGKTRLPEQKTFSEQIKTNKLNPYMMLSLELNQGEVVRCDSSQHCTDSAHDQCYHSQHGYIQKTKSDIWQSYSLW